LCAPRYVKVPNRLVDMDSWRRSACYPRSSFCPLSFGPPMRDRRITSFRFRDCLSCRTRSKAGFCACASSSISIGAKPTFVNASVTFWEASAPDKLPTRYCSPTSIQAPGSEIKLHKGGVSLTTALRRSPTYAEHARSYPNIKL